MSHRASGNCRSAAARTKGLDAAALASVAAMVLAAFGGASHHAGGGGGEPVNGGTLTFLTQADQIQHLDPQRNYTGEDLAFASAYLNRTLTSYKLSTNDALANTLFPDLATDTGTASNGAKTWKFTLRDGAKFDGGTPITCADVKYGVSRTFATKVITGGPQYAVAYLDIPKDSDGASVYKGPYANGGNDTAAFDKALSCDDANKTITFNLANPVPDFNYTVSLSAFAPVPKSADTGEKYDNKPVSSGPYKIQQYSKGSQLVLVRNASWDPANDPYRPAYPDKVVLRFGIDPNVIDQRMIKDAGADKRAASRDNVQPQYLASILEDQRLAPRRANVFDSHVYYYAVNVNRLPNLKLRMAIAAALDRAQVRTIYGGSYAGDLADGVVGPNLPKDYAPSGMWTGMLGKQIPDSGDPDYAMQLIQESGEPMPTITFDYPQSPVQDKEAASMVASLGRAGITVKPNPIEGGQYLSTVFKPGAAHELMLLAWGPDWPNGSTIIPELFTPAGGFNFSEVDNKPYSAKTQQAKETTNRDLQASQRKELNRKAMKNVWAIPTLFARAQALAGSKVKAASGKNGDPYLWAPYTSWSYTDM
jgi:peptide/nickel transport system substrate-binding protein